MSDLATGMLIGASSQAAADEARHKTETCKAYTLPEFEHREHGGSITVEQRQEYAKCVELVYPTAIDKTQLQWFVGIDILISGIAYYLVVRSNGKPDGLGAYILVGILCIALSSTALGVLSFLMWVFT
jgi:hypothetical protein